MVKTSPKEYSFKTMKSPVGELKLVASDAGLAAILWENEKPNRVAINSAHENKKHPVLVETEKQLKEYFVGKRQKFDVKLDFAGTDFQKNVWKALLNIPYGKTVSYADIAKKVGSPNAVRAVGSANGKNPICIIAGCHRVVASSGKLAGYAGGIENKVILLKLEGGKFAGKADKNSRML
ncbi:MAG: methylated-DNA--[protein]-cysteine S-methyltransferase [Candidatus Paceibacterota bacterium]